MARIQAQSVNETDDQVARKFALILKSFSASIHPPRFLYRCRASEITDFSALHIVKITTDNMLFLLSCPYCITVMSKISINQSRDKRVISIFQLVYYRQSQLKGAEHTQENHKRIQWKRTVTIDRSKRTIAFCQFSRRIYEIYCYTCTNTG